MERFRSVVRPINGGAMVGSAGEARLRGKRPHGMIDEIFLQAYLNLEKNGLLFNVSGEMHLVRPIDTTSSSR